MRELIPPVPTETYTVEHYPSVDQIWRQASLEALITDQESLLAGINLAVIDPEEGVQLALLGGQHGDEAKATWLYRFTHMRPQGGVAIRIGGGPNAGHMRRREGSSIDITNRMFPTADDDPWTKVIGRAVLAHPRIVLEEIDRHKTDGFNNSPETMMVDGKAFLAWDAHIARDKAEEELRGVNAVGTTFSGVGPAASDYAGRVGMRFDHLRLPSDELRPIVYEEVERNNRILQSLNSPVRFDPEDVFRQMSDWGRRLGPHIQNTYPTVVGALKNGQNFAAEGAQAFELGRDTGFLGSVTSTNSGLSTLGLRYRISEQGIKHRIGVVKLVETFVGNHVVHTPLLPDEERIVYDRTKERGKEEKGAVSGRERSLSWGKIPALRAAADTYGITEWIISKVDAADGLPKIRFGMEYVFPDGTKTTDYDPDDDRMRDKRTRMNMLEMDGWNRSTVGLQDLHDAPRELLAVINTFSHLTGRPVIAIGTGPGYEEFAAPKGSVFRR